MLQFGYLRIRSRHTGGLLSAKNRHLYPIDADATNEVDESEYFYDDLLEMVGAIHDESIVVVNPVVDASRLAILASLLLLRPYGSPSELIQLWMLLLVV